MSEEFYRGVVDGMSCGVLTIDCQGRVLTINEQARTILEIQGTAEGRPCSEVLRHHPRFMEVMLDSFSCSTLPSRAELELRTRDDAGRTIGFSVSRIRSAEGKDIGMAMFFKDLTQVERQEEQERLRDRLAALGQMAAQMAHEIRNPLASITVSAQLARRRLASAGEGTESVERIVHDVARVERTIASCLEYVKPLRASLKRHSLEGLLREAVGEATKHDRAAGVSIRLECEAGAGDIDCDGPRLREVFHNLLANAVEAMGGKGRITVRSRLERGPGDPNGGGQAVVEFTDTGPGVPEELRDRIFYPFFTTKTQGTGIGLAMVRKIIDLHRGVIDVSGAAGEGATFTVRLPLAAEPAERAGARGAALPEPAGAK